MNVSPFWHSEDLAERETWPSTINCRMRLSIVVDYRALPTDAKRARNDRFISRLAGVTLCGTTACHLSPWRRMAGNNQTPLLGPRGGSRFPHNALLAMTRSQFQQT